MSMANIPPRSPTSCSNLFAIETLVLSTQDALFVECKLVGITHPVGRVYAKTGISRFICGDYAWAMQEAMMLGYVRIGYSVMANLKPILSSLSYHDTLGQPTALKLIPESVCDPPAGRLYVTSHNRDFDWPHGKGHAQRIRLFHSWHDCS